jgi:hypothetical protein
MTRGKALVLTRWQGKQASGFGRASHVTQNKALAQALVAAPGAAVEPAAACSRRMWDRACGNRRSETTMLKREPLR